MSYIHPMGDGPITSPSQVDDPVVPPTRVACKDLPADSPWRDPGQICADAPISTIFDPIVDIIADAFDKPSPGAGAPGAASGPNWMLLAGLGIGAYFLFRKKKRS